ncbi:A/G-specific adenine glycosylase [Rossellomorea marisflavi]|nr:A/G-specific adenine glycosylase [Rossellomorea marisflavi]UKS66642.1 A/G-specific adenine glycosylase [Rossellomorea marisflavi]
MIDEPLKNLHSIDREAFQEDLISWFTNEQRDLPWRKDQDPYKVWVSEIMLQQTRVDTVIPYFNRFIGKFPTIDALASADEEEILKAWEGLGYYSRVRNLQAAAREVRDSYGGIVPDDPKDIATLKGVGPYTAGAILSIAYGKPEPAVDGNVMRVFSRILSIWLDIAKPSSRKVFEEAVRGLISEENPSYFNQALMELGALICTPTSPSCLLCPVREHCHAFEEGVQSELPIKSKKKSARKLNMAAAVLFNTDGKVLIHKRPGTGLLANLWEFPNFEVGSTGHIREQLHESLIEVYGVESALKREIASTFQHIFSHIIWDIDVFVGAVEDHDSYGDLIAVTPEELEKYAFPVSHQKIWKEVSSQLEKGQVRP